MKPIHLLPPILALAIAGGLIASQRSSMTRIVEETVVLRERIQLASHVPGADDSQSLAIRMTGKDGGVDGGIDWKVLGGKMDEAALGGVDGMRTMMEIRTRLADLTGDELLAEMAKIDALDLSEEVRLALNETLLGLLSWKDPRAALDRNLDRLNDLQGRYSWQLSQAFEQWQGKDLLAALAWFDTEIAKGTFDSKTLDGRSAGRLRFEAIAVQALLSSDPAAAAKRVGGLPENQRLQLFQQGTMASLKGKDQLAFAELVRSTLPEDQHADAYMRTVSSLVGDGDYEKVDDFISNIEASSEEKTMIVGEAASSRMRALEGKVDRAAVDEMRAWVTLQSPDHVDAIAGKSLANVRNEKSSFEDRVRIVSQLHDEGAGDDLIISFLEEGAPGGRSAELSRALAERVTDETKRAELISRIEE